MLLLPGSSSALDISIESYKIVIKKVLNLTNNLSQDINDALDGISPIISFSRIK